MVNELKDKCQNCESRFTYATNKDIVCRNCGFRKKREEVKKI